MTNNADASLLDGESVIWEGRPNWKAWPGLTILGFVLAPVVVGLGILAWLAIRKRSLWWKLTNRRIEDQSGWISRRVDTIELWRVKDVEFHQGIWDRIVGVSSIVVTSQDATVPVIEVRGLPPDRGVYDRLMRGVMEARQLRGVVNLNQ